jgi:hypothetical protein
MGLNGKIIYDSSIDNLYLFCGSGDDTVTVNGTGAGVQTIINGGAGDDTFIVNDSPNPLATPLVIIGGTNGIIGNTLIVNGSGNGNDFVITGTTINGLGAVLEYEEIQTLTVNGIGGNNAFIVNGDSASTFLNGGTGDDTFIVNSSVDPLYLTGGTGNDTFTINANSGMLTAVGGASNNGFTLDGNGGTITLNGNGTGDSFVINGNSGGLTVIGGPGADTFIVNSLSAPAVLNAGTGSATFTVNTPLAAVLTVNGAGFANDWLTINGTTGNSYVTITGSTVNGLGATIYYNATNLVVNGSAGNDTFQIESTSAGTTRINGGSTGSNTFNVMATSGALYLIGGAVSSNTFNLGSMAPTLGGTLANLAGPIFITGGTNLMRLITLASTGTNTVNVDDSGDFAGNSGTLTSSTLTGLGMGAGVTFVSVNVMHIYLGSGSDTFNVQSTNSTTVTTLNTGTGADVINIGSLAPGTGGIVSGIQGALIVVGGGNDTMNVDDTGSATGQTGTLTATTLTGLGMGASGITYSGVVALNINLGSGNDTFNVPSTNSATSTTLNTGAGTNVVNVGSLEPVVGGVVSSIQGALTVVGSGNDTLNVDNTGSTTGQSGTLSATMLTGLGIGTGGITYSGLAVLNINLGSGNDTFTITGVSSSTTTTVNGEAGTNTAILNISGNFAAPDLILLNFATASIYVGGNFSGVFNDAGAITTVTIGGSLTSTGVLNAGSIGTMTVDGDLAGLLDVTGLLGTLTVDGGTPGEIIVGNVHLITVLAGYGNSLLNLTEAGIQREILATPVAGGTMPNTVHFAFVYDSETATVPQVAIRITDTDPIARSYNLALVVVNSSTAKFDLSLLDSYLNRATGISNISIEGDLLVALTAPEVQLFTDLTTSSRAGVVLPLDNITGVEVSDILPIGFIDVTGIEGLAFAILTNASGTVVSVSSPLGQGSSLWNLLGSDAVVNPASDAFVVPFNSTEPVRFFVHDNTTLDLEQIMTLTDELNNNLQVTAYVQVTPTTNNSINPLVQSLAFVGSGGSVNCTLSIANITSTGPLGDVTVSGSSGTTVNNAAGLGNITAPSIFGSIDVMSAGIYGVIQTTSGDIGQTVVNSSGEITSVTTIVSNGAITGQIISRGNLVSSIQTNGAFSGVIAAQGNIGTIQRDSNGNAVTSSANALTRFGGISISGNDSGQVIALGNVFGNVTVSGAMTGRIAVEGVAVAGLAATRFGILGNVSVTTFALGSAIISGGLAGDSVGGTNVYLGSANGFVAAAGSVTLRSTTIAAANLLQNQTGSNLAALDAIFTNSGSSLLFDTGGTLTGLALIETDLTNIKDSSGVLSGTVP